MKQRAWRTGPPHQYPSPVVKPSGGQLIRQGLILLIIMAVWGGALAIFINASASSDLTLASAAAPTSLPAAVPSPMVVPSPTATALPPAATTAPVAIRTPLAATATTVATSLPTAIRTPLAPTAITVATSSPTELPTNPPPPIESSATPPPASGAQVSFARDVQPILNRVCMKCHGGEEVKEGLVLKSYAETLTGSDNGPVIAPGDPANSLLIDLITQGKMPKQGPKLLPGEIRAITDWVAAGAVNN